jgi:hypothetical protein
MLVEEEDQVRALAHRHLDWTRRRDAFPITGRLRHLSPSLRYLGSYDTTQWGV